MGGVRPRKPRHPFLSIAWSRGAAADDNHGKLADPRRDGRGGDSRDDLPPFRAAGPGRDRGPGGSLYSENGARGGLVGLAPVLPDRLLEPRPEGLEFLLVITIHTDGPMNFDEPVPVKFPNLPDPRTGEVLPPDGKTALWNFNHDTGCWGAQGLMTVSADAAVTTSAGSLQAAGSGP